MFSIRNKTSKKCEAVEMKQDLDITIDTIESDDSDDYPLALPPGKDRYHASTVFRSTTKLKSGDEERSRKLQRTRIKKSRSLSFRKKKSTRKRYNSSHKSLCSLSSKNTEDEETDGCSIFSKSNSVASKSSNGSRKFRVFSRQKLQRKELTEAGEHTEADDADQGDFPLNVVITSVTKDHPSRKGKRIPKTRKLPENQNEADATCQTAFIKMMLGSFDTLIDTTCVKGN